MWHDFSTTAHLTVLGDTESGKTNLLRLVARAVTRCYTPDEASVVLVDLRRELYDAVPPEYRLGYAVSAAVASQIVTDMAGQLRERMPGQDITPEQLRRRDWWTGPEMFLLIDDYDLVASSASSPFQPLVEFLPQAVGHRPARRRRPRRGGLDAHVDGPGAAPPVGVQHARRGAVLPALRRACCSATSGPGSSRPAGPCC